MKRLLSFIAAGIVFFSFNNVYANIFVEVYLKPGEIVDGTSPRLYYTKGTVLKINYSTSASSNHGISLNVVGTDPITSRWVPIGTSGYFYFTVPYTGYYEVELLCNDGWPDKDCDGYASMKDI